MENRALNDYFNACIEKFSLPSLQVIVCRSGSEIYRYQYNCPENSIYIGYSSTKPFIGAAISKLICEGKTSLDTPAYEYLPEMSELRVFEKDASGMITGERKLSPDKPVLIRHLASMTSGIADNIWTDYIRSSIESGKRSTRDIVSAILRQPLSFEPGCDYKYGLSLDVLAAVIEVITGQKLSEYLSECFIKPLGMADTTFHPSPDQRKRLLPQYMWYNDGGFFYLIPGENELVFTDEYESGGAGLYFTGDDYMKFAQALSIRGIGANGAKVMPSSAVELMRTPLLNCYTASRFRSLLGFPGYTYGIGVRVMSEPEKCGFITPAGEFGWQGKGGTYCSVSPELETAIFMGIQICDYHPVNIIMHTEMREKIYTAILNGEL